MSATLPAEFMVRGWLAPVLRVGNCLRATTRPAGFRRPSTSADHDTRELVVVRGIFAVGAMRIPMLAPAATQAGFVHCLLNLALCNR